MLNEIESKSVLRAYGIDVVPTRFATDGNGAVACAADLGFPVALKITSPDIVHKSDVGGVALNLETPEAVRSEVAAMTARVHERVPGAKIEGFSIQPMVRRGNAFEVLVGAKTDPVFGPVIVFGHGGDAVEVIADTAVSLPPLNGILASDLIGRTRIAALLRGYRNRPAASLQAIEMVLLRISTLLIDQEEILELDINPLLVDPERATVLDARIRVAAPPRAALAITPYPVGLDDTRILNDGSQVLLRPIRPEDEPAHVEFLRHLTGTDIYFRFFGLVRNFEHSQVARFTQIDYNREMAFIAVRPGADSAYETLGVVRAIFDPDNIRAEFAIIVRSDMKGLGLGTALLDKLIRYCRNRGTRELAGEVLAENRPMLDLAAHLGFIREATSDFSVVAVRLPLQTPESPVPTSTTTAR
jgi:acetyltransferase